MDIYLPKQIWILISNKNSNRLKKNSSHCARISLLKTNINVMLWCVESECRPKRCGCKDIKTTFYSEKTKRQKSDTINFLYLLMF